ncbi:glycosyltransferase family 2 protein [Cohnella zeiphila]|uniref:Glycosyltransferase family 2 protein n=1 Tax=Cohnella zeiphila TaxID=2761120 RepID=A0A7X0SMU3_9BACL|nr:glycosyltransferase family 2 protein [Cohnella zeiphila]MBB6731774.1 glycosyltransferase family 2 protein [Cohnella zeiphila]
MNDRREAGLVSVVVTHYNNGNYLADCLDGIVRQTYADWELILVDDASTDDSRERLEKWLREGGTEKIGERNLVVLRLPRNIGYAGACTTGMFLARGQYIAMQDSDDVSLPERLERQVAFLDSHPQVDMLGTNYEVIDGQGSRMPVKASWLRYGDSIVEVYRKGGHCVCHGTVMLRGELFDRTGGHTRFLAGAEDYEFIAKRLNAKRRNVENLPDLLYLYRRHLLQRSRSFYGSDRGGRDGS